MFLGPRGDGKSSETGILRAWPPAGPPLVWQREVGEGYAGPVVSAGRLFLFDREGENARLTCLSSETGEELWQAEYASVYEDYYDYSRGPRASPTVDGDRVYTFGVEGRLRCHRVADGELLWDVDTAGRFGVVQNFFGVGAAPVVEGDLLLVVVGGSPPDSPSIQSGEVVGDGSGVVAFDKRTGEVRYAVSDELAGYSSPTLATIDGRRWAFVFARGGLLGFDPTNGEVDFHFPWRSKVLESVNAANPVVVGDRVLISECYGPGSALLAVRPGGYDVVWIDQGRDRVLQSHWATPIHHDGWIYGTDGRHSGSAELRAFNLATREIGWSQPDLGRTTHLWVDDHLIVLGEYGKLSLIESTPEAFRLVAESELAIPHAGENDPDGGLLRYPAWTPPVLSHGLLYLRGKDRLVALELIPG
ncbi:PQQ-like beta-propeller repeat protein [bacterium]|nr:PQQ-like beta-propeller repeat protein [bacterium]